MEEKLGDEIERAISAAGSRLDFAFEDTASDGRKPEMTEEDLQVELEDRARDIVLDTMKAERLEKWKQLEEKISKLAPSPNRGGDSNKMFADSLSPLRDAMEERSMGSMGSPRRARRGKSFAPQPQSGKKRSGSIDAEQLEELFQKGKEELAGLWHSSKFKTALANVRHMSEEEERQKEREKKEEEERKRQIVEREVAWKTVLRRMRRYTTIACLPKLCPSAAAVEGPIDCIREEMLARLKKKMEAVSANVAELSSFTTEDDERLRMEEEEEEDILLLPTSPRRNEGGRGGERGGGRATLSIQQEARITMERQNELLRTALHSLMKRREEQYDAIMEEMARDIVEKRKNQQWSRGGDVNEGEGEEQQGGKRDRVATSPKKGVRVGFTGIEVDSDEEEEEETFAAKVAKMRAVQAAKEARTRSNSSFKPSALSGGPAAKAWGSGRRSSLEDITSPHSRPLPFFPEEKGVSRRVEGRKKKIEGSDQAGASNRGEGGRGSPISRSRSSSTIPGLGKGRERSTSSAVTTRPRSTTLSSSLAGNGKATGGANSAGGGSGEEGGVGGKQKNMGVYVPDFNSPSPYSAPPSAFAASLRPFSPSSSSTPSLSPPAPPSASASPRRQRAHSDFDRVSASAAALKKGGDHLDRRALIKAALAATAREGEGRGGERGGGEGGKRGETTSESDVDTTPMKLDRQKQEMEKQKAVEDFLVEDYLRKYEARQEMYGKIDKKVKKIQKQVTGKKKSSAFSSAPFHVKPIANVGGR